MAFLAILVRKRADREKVRTLEQPPTIGEVEADSALEFVSDVGEAGRDETRVVLQEMPTI
jgi:hypothetical protein